MEEYIEKLAQAGEEEAIRQGILALLLQVIETEYLDPPDHVLEVKTSKVEEVGGRNQIEEEGHRDLRVAQVLLPPHTDETHDHRRQNILLEDLEVGILKEKRIVQNLQIYLQILLQFV